MDSTAVIVVLYVAGALLLVAEVFVPSHGLLTVGALICLGVAVYHTFGRTTTGGAIALIACITLVPAVLLLGIKNVHRLPLGDRLAPPNPPAQRTQYETDQQRCAALLGHVGRSVTPLRPVGICEFDGERINCVAESGIIDARQVVVGVGVQLNNLVVRPQANNSQTV